ncbi:MAG: hypothetical protein GY851_06930, partial [bacterium]|nr:hypothetical protein [bacterium]
MSRGLRRRLLPSTTVAFPGEKTVSDTQQPDGAAWRIIDANLNRAREALRVIEEFARFVLDDANLSR